MRSSFEKLGREDLCPCGSGRRFQEVLSEKRTVRRRTEELLPAGMSGQIKWTS
ncbi:MAG: SEC-C metal-binding domain-containing protein [Acidimicrobiales bacterium]